MDQRNSDEQQEVQKLAGQLLDEDLYLVDVEVKGSSARRYVWVFLESESGNIPLDRCEQFSRQLALLLDASGWHTTKYTLNVSSPGVDRPLKDLRQYTSNIGRKAEIDYSAAGQSKRVCGRLMEVSKEKIILELDSGASVEIAFADINETRILVSFD